MTQLSSRPASGVRRFVKDPFPGMSHGVGAILGVVGLLCLLLTDRRGAAAITGVSIYGISLVMLYTASALAHSIYAGPRAESWLDRCDYAAIFFLIAGTYTPICLTTLHGTWGITMLSAQWAMAALGATMVLVVGPRKIWVALYLPMGWAVLAAISPIAARMPPSALICLIVGGALYSVGAIVFVLKRPRLWPGRFDSHDLWHSLVLAASACHFATVWIVTAA